MAVIFMGEFKEKEAGHSVDYLARCIDGGRYRDAIEAITDAPSKTRSEEAARNLRKAMENKEKLTFPEERPALWSDVIKAMKEAAKEDRDLGVIREVYVNEVFGNFLLYVYEKTHAAMVVSTEIIKRQKEALRALRAKPGQTALLQ